MKNYEMVVILDPGLDPASFEEKTKFLRGILERYDGTIQNVSSWGKRKLAYDIDKKDAGYYVVFNFQIPSQGLLEFKDSIRHDLEILRYLIVVKRQPPTPVPSTSSAGESTPADGDERVRGDDDDDSDEPEEEE